MQVDIVGNRTIPGLGCIPPVYKKDLSEKEIRDILIKEPSLRVYLPGSRTYRVTLLNLHMLIVRTATDGSLTKPLLPPTNADRHPVKMRPINIKEAPKEEAPAETPAEEVTEAPAEVAAEATETPVETPAEEVTAEEAPKEDAAAEEETPAEETVEEAAKASSKKKRK